MCARLWIGQVLAAMFSVLAAMKGVAAAQDVPEPKPVSRLEVVPQAYEQASFQRDGVGITLFDHPDNPNHPSYFHVRNDGWMGASLTYDGPRQIAPDKPLHVRYGLYVHSDMKTSADIEKQWKAFGDLR